MLSDVPILVSACREDSRRKHGIGPTTLRVVSTCMQKFLVFANMRNLAAYGNGAALTGQAPPLDPNAAASCPRQQGEPKLAQARL